MGELPPTDNIASERISRAMAHCSCRKMPMALLYTLALAHSYVFCSQYTDGLGSGVHCIKKRLSFVRPMHQVRPSLPFSHTHCAQSITNLDTARDHLTHTREPDIAWRSRRAERCLSACWFLAGCNWRPRVPCE